MMKVKGLWRVVVILAALVGFLAFPATYFYLVQYETFKYHPQLFEQWYSG